MNVVLDKRIRIEYPVTTQDSYGAPVHTYALLATVWANVQDVVPSRSEAVRQGLATSRSQTRVRFRYRSDLTTAMRIVLGTRIMNIVGGPAELGQHEFSEVVCETYSS